MLYLTAKHFAQRHGESGVMEFMKILNNGGKLRDLQKSFPMYSIPQLSRYTKLYVVEYKPSRQLIDALYTNVTPIAENSYSKIIRLSSLACVWLSCLI